jgi:hypothetical protein
MGGGIDVEGSGKMKTRQSSKVNKRRQASKLNITRKNFTALLLYVKREQMNC